MNASAIITNEMSLEQKLVAIDQAIMTATIKAAAVGEAPVDPASLTMCEGCQ